jgi:hypothetical protein
MDEDWDAEFQLHLQSCPACSELVTELKLIANEAHELAETAEPPARVWVAIANQLRAEGIIHEPDAVTGRPMLVPPRPRRWHAWWLAPVAAAIVAVGAYQLTNQKNLPAAPQVAQQSSTQSATAAQRPANQSPAQAVEPVPQAGQQVAQLDRQSNPPLAAPSAGNPKLAANTAANTKITRVISPPANAEDEQFLSEVSERAPGMRTTYENQLRAINAEVRETQAYIKRFPADADARQHLMEVYEQKALLYQMALDRIQ